LNAIPPALPLNVQQVISSDPKTLSMARASFSANTEFEMIGSLLKQDRPPPAPALLAKTTHVEMNGLPSAM